MLPRVSLVSFAAQADVILSLNSAYDLPAIQLAIQTAPYLAGSTAIGRALDAVRTSVLVPAAGHRVGTQTVVFVLTDGRTQETQAVLTASAAALKSVPDVTVFAAGIGDVDAHELSIIASSPASQHEVFFDSFAALLQDQLAEDVANLLVCPDTVVFVEDPYNCTNTTRPVDLVFVFDSSGSLGVENWQLLKDFAIRLTRRLFISPTDIR